MIAAFVVLLCACYLFTGTAFNFTQKPTATRQPPTTATTPPPLGKRKRRQTHHSNITVKNSSSEGIFSRAIISQGLQSLTIILPAFNEEKRIGETITDYSSHFIKNYDKEEQQCLDFNILVVDDGSTDQTCAVVRNIAKSLDRVDYLHVSCVSLQRNEGKGAAISKGIEEICRKEEATRLQQQSEEAQGKYQISGGNVILVADADGSGSIESLEEMMEELWRLVVSCPPSGTSNRSSWFDYSSPWHIPAMVVGNRGLNSFSLSRSITRWGFRTAVKIVCGNLQSKDTQCGFKLMTIEAAKILYSDLNLRRWTNDVEVLYRAKLLNIPVSEVVICWEDKQGSKLATSAWKTIQISVIMLLEIIYMRFQYFTGRWT